MVLREMLMIALGVGACGAFLAPALPPTQVARRNGLVRGPPRRLGPCVFPARRAPLAMMMSAELEGLTVAALRDKLAELGDKPPSKMRKAELIERIKGMQVAEPKWAAEEEAGGESFVAEDGDGGVMGEGNLLGALSSLEEEMARSHSSGDPATEPVRLDAGSVWGLEGPGEDADEEAPVWGEAAGWGEATAGEESGGEGEGEGWSDAEEVEEARDEVPSPFDDANVDADGVIGGVLIDEMTVSQLKDALKERGLKVGGVKAELIDRLTEAAAGTKSQASGWVETRAPASTPRREGGGGWSEGNMDERQRSGGLNQDTEWRQREWAEKSRQGEADEERTVFVRGLPFGARPEEVVGLFEEAGEVDRVEGMFSRNRATGRAWITFENGEQAGGALDLHKAELQGRYIEVYPPWSRPARQALRQIQMDQEQQEGYGSDRQWAREERGYGGRSNSGYGRSESPFNSPDNRGRSQSSFGDEREGPKEVGAKSSSIFVGRIPLGAAREDIEDALSPCGEITDIRMGVRNGQFQGFAHVDFADQSSADAAVALGAESLEVKGREVRLDYAPARHKICQVRVKSDYALGGTRQDREEREAMPRELHGLLIGVGGERVRDLEKRSGARICFEVDPEEVMVIRGTPDQRARARTLAKQLVMSIAEETVEVERDKWSAIIGVKGTRIREMEIESGARMVLREDGPDMVPVLAVHGTPEARASAIQLAMAVIERETTEARAVDDSLVGVLVGRRGFTVKLLEAESGAYIRLERYPEAIMSIKGTAVQREKAAALTDHLVDVLPSIMRKLVEGEGELGEAWEEAWEQDQEAWEEAVGGAISEAMTAWKDIRMKQRKIERGLAWE